MSGDLEQEITFELLGIRHNKTRNCGKCTLCCRLLPTGDGKPANTKCPHSRRHRGCTIYDTRPRSCRLWSCSWLIDQDIADNHNGILRPDRGHYIIDPVPDYVSLQQTDCEIRLRTIQVWCDPRFPEAYKAAALKQYLREQAKKNSIGLVRYSSHDAFLWVAPEFTKLEDFERVDGNSEAQHDFDDIFRTLGLS